MIEDLLKMLADGLRPEVRVLLYCARSRMDSERAALIKVLLKQEIDWDYLHDTALLNKTIPLLYWNLNSVCPEAVPKAAMDRIRNHFHANAARNILLSKELLKLLRLFEANEIPAIPYKGPVLAAMAYDNLALREFDDLDFLVPKKDVSKVCGLLRTQGYSAVEDQLTPAQLAAYTAYYGEYVFIRDDGRVAVEPHWAITGKNWAFPLDCSLLFERAKPISIDGATVLTFAPEDLLLILCVHGSIHEWKRLEWICDVAELIGSYQGIDWVRTLQQARTLGSERMLLLGLFLTNLLLGAPLPKEAVQRIQADRMVKILARKVQDRLFSNVIFTSGVSKFKRTLFCIRMRERLRDKVLYLLRTMSTPHHQHFKLLPLPPSLFCLYRLLVPAWNLVSYGPGLVKGVLSSGKAKPRFSAR